MKKVGVVLVNYKDYARKFLDECRDSLRAQSYPDFKVYIIDNASSAGSLAYLKSSYPEAEIIPREDGNYCAANNAGLKAARRDGAEVFIIANLDTKFAPGWIGELVAALDSSPEIGLAQSKILIYPKAGEKARINSLGNLLHFLGFGFTGSYNEEDRAIDGYPEIKGYASGCSFAIKKEVLDEIGGYNEKYYMYHDDIEMGWKAKLAGYKIVLAPKSVCYHKYEFSRSVQMLYYMERNRFLVLFTFYEAASILAILPALLIMEAGLLVYSFFHHYLGTKLRVYLYLLRPSVWKDIASDRKTISFLRKRPDREIVGDFTGEVLFQEINNPILEKIANPFFEAYWRIAKKFIS